MVQGAGRRVLELAAPRVLSSSLRDPAGPPQAGDGWLRFPFPPSEAEYNFIKITEEATGVSLGKEIIPGKTKLVLCIDGFWSHEQPFPAFWV